MNADKFGNASDEKKNFLLDPSHQSIRIMKKEDPSVADPGSRRDPATADRVLRREAEIEDRPTDDVDGGGDFSTDIQERERGDDEVEGPGLATIRKMRRRSNEASPDLASIR